jgi:AcrR family transcriptional regulator
MRVVSGPGLAGAFADGRLARSERARAAVVDGLLALIEEGDLWPTAPRIAERAGVSLRLVFHHFADLEALFAAAAQRMMERVLPTLKPVPQEGPLEGRLAAFVAERTRLYERIGRVRRAALLQAPFSPVIAERVRLSRELKRAEVQAVFRIELDAWREPARSELSAAIACAASFSSWEELRTHQGLASEQVAAVLTRTLRALLEPPPREQGKAGRAGGPRGRSQHG